jgi:hypothetical protein
MVGVSACAGKAVTRNSAVVAMRNCFVERRFFGSMSFGQSLTSLPLGQIPEPNIKTGEALGAPVEFGLTISTGVDHAPEREQSPCCAPSRSSSLRALPLPAAD